MEYVREYSDHENDQEELCALDDSLFCTDLEYSKQF